MQVQDIIQVASYVDKFHFIKDSKLPSLNPRKAEAVQTQKTIEGIVDDQEF